MLANENIPRPLIRALRDRHHDVTAVAEVSPGMLDGDVLTLAVKQDRLLLTQDKGYGELVLMQRTHVPGVVLLRSGREGVIRRPEIMAEAISSRDDWFGHFSVIEPGRIRMITLRTT